MLSANKFSCCPGYKLIELEPRACDHARETGRQHHHVKAALHGARRKRRAGAIHNRLEALPVCCL